MRGIKDLAVANEFWGHEYIAEFSRQFAVAAAEKGSAFVRLQRKDLDWIFKLQHERAVNQDNTVLVSKSRLAE